ncbi:hypothetical protein [Halovenus marina]
MTDDIDPEDLRRTLQELEIEAADHNAEYAAGIRHARQCVESEHL